MIQLVEVYQHDDHGRGQRRYNLREIFINPKHVVAIRPDNRMSKLLNEGYLPEDMDKRQGFTKVYLDRGQTGIDLTVVGEAGIVSGKLGISQKELLRG
tara:strand:- start:1673 stop:1966 length:294 start_codon:yes stop_codon:yes gene_type:complete